MDLTDVQIIEKLGGPTPLAEYLGVTRQAVQQWKKKKKIPSWHKKWILANRSKALRAD